MIKSDAKTFMDMLSSTKGTGLRVPTGVDRSTLIKKSIDVKELNGNPSCNVISKIQIISDTWIYYKIHWHGNLPKWFKLLKITQE